MKWLLALVLVPFALVVGACGGSDDDSATTTASPVATAPVDTAATVIEPTTTAPPVVTSAEGTPEQARSAFLAIREEYNPRFGEINEDIEALEADAAPAVIDDILTRYADTLDAALADYAEIRWPANARDQGEDLLVALRAEAAAVRGAITSDRYAPINDAQVERMERVDALTSALGLPDE